MLCVSVRVFVCVHPCAKPLISALESNTTYSHAHTDTHTNTGAAAAAAASSASERLLPHTSCRALLTVRAGVSHDLALAHGSVREAEDAVAEVASVADPAPFLDTEIRCVPICV